MNCLLTKPNVHPLDFRYETIELFSWTHEPSVKKNSTGHWEMKRLTCDLDKELPQMNHVYCIMPYRGKYLRYVWRNSFVTVRLKAIQYMSSLHLSGVWVSTDIANQWSGMLLSNSRVIFFQDIFHKNSQTIYL